MVACGAREAGVSSPCDGVGNGERLDEVGVKWVESLLWLGGFGGAVLGGGGGESTRGRAKRGMTLGECGYCMRM